MSDQMSTGNINLPTLEVGDFFKMFIASPNSSDMVFKIYQVLSEDDMIVIIDEMEEKSRPFYHQRQNFIALLDDKGDRGVYQRYLVDRAFVMKVDKPDDWK